MGINTHFISFLMHIKNALISHIREWSIFDQWCIVAMCSLHDFWCVTYRSEVIHWRGNHIPAASKHSLQCTLQSMKCPLNSELPVMWMLYCTQILMRIATLGEWFFFISGHFSSTSARNILTKGMSILAETVAWHQLLKHKHIFIFKISK